MKYIIAIAMLGVAALFSTPAFAENQIPTASASATQDGLTNYELGILSSIMVSKQLGLYERPPVQEPSTKISYLPWNYGYVQGLLEIESLKSLERVAFEAKCISEVVDQRSKIDIGCLQQAGGSFIAPPFRE